ncbi:hypothetical protein AC1031_003171 [Aphanomyces cochlioides]|nr:hypothetical protein AC1031_003171 [Aphanomyces cochlioides]
MSGVTPIKSSSAFDVWALGVIVVMGGQSFAWNAGLVAGTISYGIGVVLMGVAYSCGVYGLARCTLDCFYFGFMAGCCQLLQYVLCIATTNFMLSQFFSTWWPCLVAYTPLLWKFVVLLAVVIMTLFFIYFLASTTANMAAYAGGMDNAFVGGFSQFFTMLPQASWTFSGIEALSTISQDMTEPKRLIPKGKVTSMLTLLATARL